MPEDPNWSALQAKALAFLAYKQAQLDDGDLATKANFLEGLGVPRGDAARMLGSTPESIRVAIGTANRGGGKRAKKPSK